MAKKNDELLKRLLATFRIEADEHLKAMSSGLLALEKHTTGTEAASIVETVFREAHSLKGAARAVNLAAIESLCQALESVFAVLKKASIPVSLALLDLLHRAVKGLDMLLACDPPSPAIMPPAIAELIHQLDQAADGALPDTAATVPVAEAATASADSRMPPAALAANSETIRISTMKLDAVMRQVEELLLPRLATRQRVLELRDIANTVAAWKKKRAQVQPLLRRIERAMARANDGAGTEHSRDKLLKTLDYLDSEQLFITTIEDHLSRLHESAARDHRTLAGMADSLLQDVKEMQLLPFSSLFDLLPSLARELARAQGKEVELALHGGEIELDRRMMDALKDPLIHLLRNAIDHGIETPAVRAAAGKPARGTVTLMAAQRDSGKIELLVADDGGGIDGERVKTAAGKLGVIPAGAGDRLDAREVFALVFQSGVSTSPIITDVSGRGLGLAIVREKVEHLGGSISIDSAPGKGSTFHMTLPLTLATLRGVLVRAGERLCVISAAGVERVARIAIQDIRTVENRDTIVLDAQVVTLVDLAGVLETAPVAEGTAAVYAPVIVLGQNGARVAFRVDEILGEQEILVKNLGPQLARVRNVAGACMLGTGQVVPVLNVADLLQSAVTHVAALPAPAMTAQPATGARRSILVAEDSITSRALLKNILESAGYAVTTAVDGMEAFTTLKTAAFDLVVSDVEMPRMDGFDLTARMRADKQLAELPVVLVTALESREHRERGIDVGANAYIVKSSFDQSNLLEIIRRLL